jgi:hypothetical protein
MRRLLPLLFLAGALAAPAGAGSEPARHALLIGVSGYERPGTPDGWWALHTGNDIEAVRTLLTRSFGFPEENLHVLTSPEATTGTSIVRGFRDLIARVEPGDIVFVQYSGHGNEIPDQDGDELDGRDESLVPSDYVSRVDGSRNLRDDMLGELLEELAARKPGSATFVFDCCFSGTATRGGRCVVRGGSTPGPAPTRSGGGASARGGGLVPRGHPLTQGVVVLSATAEGQVAHETQDPETGKVMGLLTWAFVQAAARADGETSYRDLYERMLAAMGRENHEQTPTVEGPLDRILFGGRIVPPRSYVPITLSGDGTLYLEAGSLQGMTLGSRFRLFPAGARDLASQGLGEATVTSLDLNYAVLTPVAAVDAAALDAGRAVETAHAFGDNRLRVRAENLPEALLPAGFISTLAVMDAGATWDLRVRGIAGGGVLVERQDGSVVDTLTGGPALARDLRTCVEGEARWRFLNALTSEDPGASVRIELRVAGVEPARDASGKITGIAGESPIPLDDSGRPAIPAGRHVVLELRNAGFEAAHVTVLDLRPDGKVGPLWPHPGLRAQDNRIPPDGEWHRIGYPFVFRIDDPGHHEVFKAIATSAPADFSPLLDPRALAERAESPERSSPIGRRLAALTLGERCDAAAVPLGDWATAEVRFRVVDAP